MYTGPNAPHGIKNTGKGDSVEPTALLKNLGGAEVFIDLGRQRLEALPSGTTGTARFLFKVQQPPASQGFEGPPPSKIDLRLQVFDGVLGDYLVEKLSFPIKATKGPAVSAKKKPVPLVVEANAPVSILAAADASSMVLARAETGARFDALAEINGFVRVRLSGAEKASGNLYGYVVQTGVSPAKGKATASVSGEPAGLSLVYGRDPPTISFLDSTGAAQGEYVVTASDKFDIKAHIVDDGKVNDAYVFVADQKVYYQRFGAAARGPTDVTLSHSVPLKPGVNVITVVAREDDEFAQREVVTVFSTSGDPLAAKKSVGH
jgi:carboxyl-terminal processing protease